MASEQHDTVFPEEDQDQDLEDDDESSEDDDLEENDDVLPDEEEDDDEDLNSASASTHTPVPAITVAFPSAVAVSTPVSTSVVTVAVPPGAAGDDPDPKRQRVSVQEEKKQPLPQQLDESRRLFQRLWTDEDEIGLLQGFLDYSSQRGNVHHHDTALFYDQIKSKLQLDFNKNQLVEKLRRLKKKYRNVLSKIDSGKDFAFKTAHDQATFEISRKIWSNCNNTNNTTPTVNALEDEDANHNNNQVNYSNEVKINHHNNSSIVVHNSNNYEEKATPRSRKRSRSKAVASENVVLMNSSENPNTDNVGAGGNIGTNGIAGVVEETVRSCLAPLFKDFMSNVMGGLGDRGIGGLAMNAVMPLGLGGAPLGFSGCGGGKMVDEKWRKQQILELEVYSKRLELVQDQIKVKLEELRSMGG